MKNILKITSLSFLLSVSLTVPASAACERFEDCLRQTLNSSEPLERALSASQGIALWNKSLPQRDLVNLLQMRAEALISLHLAGKGSERLTQQIQSDYNQLKGFLPGSWMPLAGLGRLAEIQEKPALAESYYAEAIKSKDLPAYIARAEFWIRRQEPEKALKDLDAGWMRVQEMLARQSEIHPVYRGRLHLLRAQLYTELQRGLEARLEMESACEQGVKEACINNML